MTRRAYRLIGRCNRLVRRADALPPGLSLRWFAIYDQWMAAWEELLTIAVGAGIGRTCECGAVVLTVPVAGAQAGVCGGCGGEHG